MHREIGDDTVFKLLTRRMTLFSKVFFQHLKGSELTKVIDEKYFLFLSVHNFHL